MEAASPNTVRFRSGPHRVFGTVVDACAARAPALCPEPLFATGDEWMSQMSTTPSGPKTTSRGRNSARRRSNRSEAAARHHLRVRLRELYHGSSPRAVRFRYGLLAFDLVTIGFVIASSFFFGSPVVEAVDVVFGLLILADVGARLLISRSPLNELVHPLGIADTIVIFSFLAPLAGESFAFLRIVRALRLFRSYQLVSRVRAISRSSGATRTPCSASSTCSSFS